MKMPTSKRSVLRSLGYGFALLGAASATGCHVGVAGQTFPSSYWHDDDVQHSPQGPDMKVAKEAAAQAKHKVDREAEVARRPVPSRLR